MSDPALNLCATAEHLTPLKKRILEIVKRSGPDGIPGDELFRIVYDGRLPRYRGGHAGRGESRQRSALKANVHQLNRALALSGYQIACSERSPHGCYRLVQQCRTNSRFPETLN